MELASGVKADGGAMRKILEVASRSTKAGNMWCREGGKEFNVDEGRRRN